ncbi:MAG: MopE-related protein [Kofleriaceae bacterium]
MVRESLVALAIVLTSCSNGSFQDCAVACSETTGCPDGYTCGSEGVCRLEGAAGLCADDPMTICRPGITAACYTGAAGTKDVGACMGGTRTCQASGTWGPCDGEIVPIAEVCGDDLDNDCNGIGDELDDQDGDGFATCSLPNKPADCCDSTADCDDPALVNPGAFDIPGNGVDDDCNTVMDDPASCDDALSSNSTSALDFAKAIELCRRTTTPERTWGVLSAKLSLTSGSGTPDREGHAIRPQFGPGVTPRIGESLAILSTGGAAAKTDTLPGFHAFGGYAHVAGPTSTFPADWMTANNNVLPKTAGCPQPTGTAALDPVMLTFQIRVPTNARSFELVSSYFAADFPSTPARR